MSERSKLGIVSTLLEIARREKTKAIGRGDYVGAMSIAYVEEVLKEG